MSTTEQLNTALEGRYRIERRIGEGGMAVVYLARDLKHQRQVALKVLNPELGAVLGSERFMAEIEVTANLHHPNLLPLFDSGEAGGLLFYVMPFVEGETLRARLTRERQLSVDEAVRIATAVAQALDYAHRHQVIHRDLKPENILLHEGQPLVMDFGIALAVSKAGGARITQTGLSLGTPQYMSPEQATGDHRLDGRSDIYSLGAVLYEMLTGDPPHTGSTVQAVIAKVITEQPGSIRALRNTVPEHLEAVTFTALAKVPADRFATAADFAAALGGARSVAVRSGIASGTGPGSVRDATRTAGAVGTTAGRRFTGAAVAGWLVALGALGTAGWLAARTSPAPSPLMRLALEIPDSIAANGARARSLHSVGLSSDGTMAVITGTDREGRNTLYLRDMAGTELRKLANIEGSSPTFSPDNKWILYGSQSIELTKIPTAGGTPMKLAEGIGSSSWGDDGMAYHGLPDGSIEVINPTDGTRHVVATPDSARGQLRLSNFDVLPGSKHALVRIATAAGGTIGVVDLKSGKSLDLGIVGWTPKYVEPGYLLFESEAGVLSAIRFSLRNLRTDGEVVRLAEGVERLQNGGLDYAVARSTGTILFRWRPTSSYDSTQLVLTGPNGVPLRVLRNDGRRYDYPRVSADGRHVLVRVDGVGFDTGDLWTVELATGALTRLTSNNRSYRGQWSRDGKRIVYLTGGIVESRVMTKPWDGSGGDSVLLESRGIAEFAEGIAGGWSAVRTFSPRDIQILPTDSLRATALRPFVTTQPDEAEIAISPSGRFIAYGSQETGSREVYVRPLPGPGPRVLVSLNGGVLAEWSSDGRTLYYMRPDATMFGTTLMAATITTEPELAVTSRDSLFSLPVATLANPSRMYSALPGGRGFILATSASSKAPAPFRLGVITGWQSLFARSTTP